MDFVVIMYKHNQLLSKFQIYIYKSLNSSFALQQRVNC